MHGVVVVQHGGGRVGHPVEVFANVAMAALAIAGLVDQVVTSLGPQVLQLLLVRPRSGPALAFQVSQDGLLKGLEARRVHVRRPLAVFVGADGFDHRVEAGLDVLDCDEDVLCVGPIVIEAAFGR